MYIFVSITVIMKHKIIAFGEIVWDMLPAGKQIGGAPLNFAFFANTPQAQSYVISAIGNDPLGDETLRILESTGVGLSCVQRNDFPTSKVLIDVDENGCPEYEIVEGVAWDAIEPLSDALEHVKDASVFCWGSLAQRNQTSRQTLMTLLKSLPTDCLKVFDINIRQSYFSREIIQTSLEHSDVLKLNEDELPLVAQMLDMAGDESEIISTIIERYALKYLIYTHGADFSEVYAADGRMSHIPTPKVEVKDTVGAGDSFTASFVSSILEGATLEQSHARAVEVSASVCTKNGAIDIYAKE